MMVPPRVFAFAAALSLGGCAGDEANRPPATAVIAAVGEPSAVLPPLAFETVARDIGDLVYERLAELRGGAAPIDESAYLPRLAARWERLDSLTLRFHLRPEARWHDGRPVTAADVVFSFAAFSDSVLDALARPYLAGKVAVEVEDSLTLRLRFAEASPEQLYDATNHVRVIPRHVWDTVARADWAADTVIGRLVGSGPYRVTGWRRGEFLTLEADTARPANLRPGIARLVWRFTQDPDAALNLVLSHEADLMESLGAPDRVARVEADSFLAAVRYPAAVYGFLGFRLSDTRRPHPILGDRAVRRALSAAIDRAALARSLFGPSAYAPAGPMSGLLWIGQDGIATIAHDTAAAGRMLDAAGWQRGQNGLRRRAGRTLAFDILVPSTSPARRQLAVAMQEMWRSAGAEVTVTSVDFPVFQERIGAGRFDSYVGAYLDEPSPRGLADQWSSSGIGELNHGRYANPAFDSLLAAAGRASDTTRARRLYHEALDTLNADAAAIFLYTPVQAAAVSRRLENVTINPYSWLGTLPEWRIGRSVPPRPSSASASPPVSGPS